MILAFLAFMSCKDRNHTDDPKTQIVVSMEVMKEFIHKLAGSDTPVLVLLPPASSPVNFIPNVDLLKKFSATKLYFKSGLPFESSFNQKMGGITPGYKTIDISGLTFTSKKMTHTHGHHSQADPHVWLSPVLMKKILQIMSQELTALFPNNKKFIQTNLANELGEIDTTEKKIRQLLDGFSQKTFLVYHPSYAWYADHFNLKMLAIEQNGMEAKHKHLIDVMTQAKAAHIRTVISQPEFSSRQLIPIAQDLNARIVSLSPLQAGWHKLMICLTLYIGDQNCP